MTKYVIDFLYNTSKTIKKTVKERKMKKIKVALTNEILELLKNDSLTFNVNMNFLNNSIVDYYIKNELKKEKNIMKKEVELQFFLHQGLETKYIKTLIARKYKKEVDFLRNIFLEYIKLPINKRNEIMREYKKNDL